MAETAVPSAYTKLELLKQSIEFGYAAKQRREKEFQRQRERYVEDMKREEAAEQQKTKMLADALYAQLQHERAAFETAKTECKNQLERQQGELRREREEMERERDQMMDVRANQTDIIELNVGGRPFTTTRATLCAQPDTLLAAMFSGRWEGSVQRDKNGAVFLDFNPDLFALLLDHLRSLQLFPAKKLPSPSLSLEQLGVWETMLSYLGFVNLSQLGRFSKEYSHPNFTISNEGKTALCKTIQTTVCAVGEGVVGRGVQRTFKLRLLGGVWFGFISDSDAPTMRANDDSTNFFKWAGFNLVGGFKPAGGNSWVSGPMLTLERQLLDGQIFDLCIDTTNPDVPTVQITSHSHLKWGLPKEWERSRLAVRSGVFDTGLEILSVD